ncbi:hypothetical protein K432DRAFT_406326 [Lepidopterella palustris CBS 459.81]|uniref:Uncharacterized protein n=1 Tax=Lepidopterella palustris CBS 459.81 TaxID=1314670 RepID=A0A8E2JDK2_9PEZI|nr:hypothetical protein K432DRAFT_406326 [Lepidopterella palustris CBS 459.81]
MFLPASISPSPALGSMLLKFDFRKHFNIHRQPVLHLDYGSSEHFNVDHAALHHHSIYFGKPHGDDDLHHHALQPMETLDIPFYFLIFRHTHKHSHEHGLVTIPTETRVLTTSDVSLSMANPQIITSIATQVVTPTRSEILTTMSVSVNVVNPASSISGYVQVVDSDGIPVASSATFLGTATTTIAPGDVVVTAFPGTTTITVARDETPQSQPTLAVTFNPIQSVNVLTMAVQTPTAVVSAVNHTTYIQYMSGTRQIKPIAHGKVPPLKSKDKGMPHINVAYK